MIIYKSTGKTKTKFQDQSFFEDFNWQNFLVGDIVWLEDYRGEIDRIAGVFTGDYENPTIRLLPNVAGKFLAKSDREDILSLAEKSEYWKKYLS